MTTPSDTARLVIRATSPDENPRERNDAFAALVARYQDATFAWAYALLGDRAAVEDVSQDAFVAAWLNLSRLREPEAFGAWLRRIVQREAVRRSQAARRFVTLERAAQLPEFEAPHGDVERRETLASLLATLTSSEREATALFYIGGHSQREVAGLLGVSVAAVKQRLHTARRRLKAKGAELMAELTNERPSRDNAFAAGVSARLRAFTDADYAGMASMADGLLPASAPENAEWVANRRSFAATGLASRMYAADDAATGDVLGYGTIEQDATDPDGRIRFSVSGVANPHRFRIHLLVPSQSLDAGVGDALLAHLERDATELGGSSLWSRLYSHETADLTFLKAKGFAETRRVTEWHHDLRTVAVDSDVAVTTLADQWPVAALTDFWNAAAAEHGLDGAGPYSLDEIKRRLKLPNVVPDAYFIARTGQRIVGVFHARAPRAELPHRRVVVLHVLMEAAGTGVERALMARAVGYAKRNGVSAFETHTTAKAVTTTEPLDSLGFAIHTQMVIIEKAL